MLFRDDNARLSVGEQLARAQAAANLLGRMAVLRDARRKTDAALQLNTSSRLVAFAAAPVDAIEIYTSFTLPPVGAIEYIRKLTPVTKSVFDGLTKQYQAEAFTVAGVTDQRLLQRIRDELAEVIGKGGTPEDFRAAVDGLKSEAGVERLASVDLDTVFQTQTQKAYSSGRYEQMSDESVTEALPYWQYWTVGDDRVRPEHRALDQFCALAIDPVWRKIWPPCGWGCRCSTVALSRDEAPEGSDDGGLDRLPLIVTEKVPQPGYQGVLLPLAA